MQIRIEGFNLPGATCGPSPDARSGHWDIHVGIQHRKDATDLVGMVRADAQSVTWEVVCDAFKGPAGTDLRGAEIQGRPGNRFLYLSWAHRAEDGELRMFRRAKIMIDGVPRATLERAVATGGLFGRVGLTDPKGRPLCAAVRPPTIEWTPVDIHEV
jgi:Family of unknown function (DUF5990)